MDTNATDAVSKIIVYISHPVGEDPAGDRQKILQICRDIHLAHRGDVIPFVPYLPVTEYLNDYNTYERELGRQAMKVYFEKRMFDELWLCGDYITKGMKREIRWCQEMDFHEIKCYNPELRRDLFRYLDELNIECTEH